MLDAALAETRKTVYAIEPIKWAGNEVELKSATVRQVLLKVDDAVYALNQVKEEHTPQKGKLIFGSF